MALSQGLFNKKVKLRLSASPAYDFSAYHPCRIFNSTGLPAGENILKSQGQLWAVGPTVGFQLARWLNVHYSIYYANLLLDIPPVGVCDLGDITWEDANTWIQSFRTAVSGVGSADSFKIPVLAEHTGKVDFIPLGKDPNSIMYDRITLKYASLVTAGYGMNLGDIGVQSASSSGETLAGSIRGEQKTNRTGKARCKAKLKYFIESFLPPTLQFDFIDTDGERLSMLGRARLANATAMNQYREMEAISPEEARLQAIQDGLFTISMPEKPPKEAKKPEPTFGQTPFGKKPPERPGQVGSPQPPSMGGDGEVKKSYEYLPSNLFSAVEKIVSILGDNIRGAFLEVGDDDYEPMKSALTKTIFDADKFGLGPTLASLIKDAGDFYFDEEEFGESRSVALRNMCRRDFPVYLGKVIAYTLVNSKKLFENDVTEDVYETIKRTMPEYVSAFVGAEVEKMFADIEEELPESVRVRSIVKQTPNIITVEAPQITMPSIAMPDVNVTVPERSVNISPASVIVERSDVTVNVPEQAAPTVEVNVPEQAAPVVNVSVPEAQVRVETPVTVNVPKGDTPVVNVSVPAQQTPVVENNITVQPAEVKVPKSKREVQTVHRDPMQNIVGTTTEIEYEE